MSVLFGPIALTLDDITRQMRSTFETLIDPRKGKNKSYTLMDARYQLRRQKLPSRKRLFNDILP